MLETEFEAAELLHRIFCDPLPPLADAAYLFGQTPDNEGSVFATARDLVARSALPSSEGSQVRTLLIPGTGPLSGYPGQDQWRQRLESILGSSEGRDQRNETGYSTWAIASVPTDPTDSLNTLIEAQATVRYAKAQGYQSLIVVAAPFHQQRAVMTMISVALQEYPTLRIYSAPGQPLDWEATVLHSQGTVRGKRYALIYGELERIKVYGAKGDLAPRAAVLAYLRQRDG